MRFRNRAFALLLAALMLLIAACGGGGDESSAAEEEAPTDSTEASDIDPDGTIRYAWGATTTGPTLDPTLPLGYPNDWTHFHLIYGTLFWPTADGSVDPFMAESYEIIDRQTVSITIREGLEFSDGTPYDAEAVKFGLLRNQASTTGSLDPVLKEIEEITVESPTEVVVKLSAPRMGPFLQQMAQRESMFPSPTAAQAAGYDGTNAPVGAGPFKVEEFAPNDKLVLTKWTDQHDDGGKLFRYQRIEFADIADGPPTANALLAGQADVGPLGEITTARPLDGRNGLEVLTTVRADQTYQLGVCTSIEPFTDERVRRALSHLINREEINTSVFGGEGQPMYDFFPKDHPWHAEESEEISRFDVDQAKKLLAEAGVGDGFKVRIGFVAQQPVSGRLAEVLQQQFAQGGIEVEVLPHQNVSNTWFTPGTQPNDPLMVARQSRGGFQGATIFWRVGSVQNPCDFTDEEASEAIRNLEQHPADSDEAAKHAQQLQIRTVETALRIPIVFAPAVMVYNSDRIGGYDEPVLSGWDTNLRTAYVKR